MKTIVFLMGYYLPQCNANLNCCLNVIRELQGRNYKIVVICGTEDYESADVINDVLVYRVRRKGFAGILSKTKVSVFRVFLKLARFFRNLICLPFYPNTESAFTTRLYRKCCTILETHNVSCIVGTVYPTASVCVLKRLANNKKFHSIPRVGYYLDMLHANSKSHILPFLSYDWLCRKGDCSVFSRLDSIILPEGGESYYQQGFFDAFRSKMSFVNFPVFSLSDDMSERNNSTTTFVYAGYSNTKDRDVGVLLECLNYLELYDYRFDTYGLTEDESAIRAYEKHNSGRFHYHGLVEKKLADEALKNADFVIAFGNDSHGVIPSKIFELFGLKKRLIYITRDCKDIALKYVNQYPDKCILFKTDSINNSARHLFSFLNSPKKEIDNLALLQAYCSATPYHIADIIVSSIK